MRLSLDALWIGGGLVLAIALVVRAIRNNQLREQKALDSLRKMVDHGRPRRGEPRDGEAS